MTLALKNIVQHYIYITMIRKYKDDIVQFRLVELDENNDSVKKVLFESKEYFPCERYSEPFNTDLHECLLTANSKYSFADWENIPPMEFQMRRKERNNWEYLSDPINDYMNL